MKPSGSRPRTDFSRIFADHREDVRAHLERLVPSSEVDDLLQDVFVKASRALPRFQGGATVRTWLYRITHRTALDHLRSRRHHEQQRTIELAEEPGEEACSCSCGCPAEPAKAPGRLVQSEMQHCIREFLARLSPEHAEVLTLKELDGLTSAEISARLGISLDAAKIRLHRARAAMRTLVDRDCELYRTADNILACDRKPRPGRR